MIKDSLKERCRKILERIRKDYPILSKSKIKLRIKPLKIGSMFALKKLFYYVLIVDPIKYKDASDKQITGALAHELMHFETYEKHGWTRYIVEWFAFHFSKKLMSKSERENDRNTIKKGYARELYVNRTYRLSKCPKSYLKKIGLCYLAPKEIKSYAKKIGKW